MASVKSFFKYNDLPLGFVPTGNAEITFHNKDISKEEILAIIGISRIREQAFFSFMVQSGLRPDTIVSLQLKDLESLDKVPCKVNVPKQKTKGNYGAYFTFIGEDALYYLKRYLSERKDLGPDSLLFTGVSGKISYDRSIPSRIFQEKARKLKASGQINYETKTKGKPAELRLYTLRKYFRRMASQAGPDFVNFWMGHSLGKVESAYFPGKGEEPSAEVIEKHRTLYRDLALPNLRLETATPSETEKTIEDLRTQLTEKDETIKGLARNV